MNCGGHAQRVATLTDAKLDDFGLENNRELMLFEKAQSLRHRNLQKLPTDLAKLILKDSISPLPLHRTLVLLETLEENRDDRFYDHERLALATGVGE
ncbi:MAG: hypothetical protein WDM76_00250 [Limisphaerales bacterium]